MASGDSVRNFRDGILTIKDGTTPTANSLEVVLDQGDLSFSEVTNVNAILDRGVLYSFREADEQPIEVTFSFMLTGLTGAGAAVEVRDALKHVGNASTWDNTSTKTGELPSNDLEFVILDPSPLNSGSATDEKLVFPDFVVTNIAFAEDQSASRVTVTGICLAKSPTITRGNFG